MLLDIVILVLREILEISVLLSVLLCVSSQNKLNLKWLWFGLFFGSLAAFSYAVNFNIVSEMFDYAGQEVFNASMELITHAGLLIVCALLIFRIKLAKQLFITTILAIIIGLTITRELAEVIIFYTGFFQSQGDLVKGSTSGFIGLMVGASFGVLCYVVINSWRPPVSRLIQITLLTLIAAGMSVQAIQLLIQVDWISASKAVWNTNWILSESSIAGQLTYAILGYEAAPTKPEVMLYFATILIVGVFTAIKLTRMSRQMESV